MRKIVIITFCFIGVLLAFYLGKCIGSWPNSKETISAVEKDSGLKIPSDGKVVFTISDNVFMHGRLGQYTAISFNDKPEEFLSSNNFSSELPSDLQKQFLEGFESCYTIKREDVMDKFYPDFEGEDYYLYLENKSVFFVYDGDRKLLMVLSAVI